MKEKPIVISLFFGVFPSDRSPKAMKDVKHALLSLRLLNHKHQSGEFVKIIPRSSCGYCV
jgi:hypothetical protein